jgi:hypothetical protein
MLAIIGVGVLGSPRAIGQDTSSQPAVVAEGADALSDQEIILLRKDFASMKKHLIASNLTLTDDEATKFWPVYDQYSSDLAKITDARTLTIKEYAEGYGTLTEAQADDLIRRWLDADIPAAQLRRKYVPIIRKVLPGTKAATFFQLDRRVSTMIDLQVTSRVRLVQSQD